jgi:hypothetical protein
MTSALRFPPLVVPFTALGGAAGWLWRDVLLGRFDGGAIPARSHLAVAAVAIIGGLAGALVGPVRAAEEWMAPRPSPARVVVVVLGAGLAAGMILAALVAPTVPWAGAPSGLAAAVPLIPACLLVIAAQRRADQGRPGSIVARAEQRAVHALVALGMVILAALMLPDWMSTSAELLRPAHDAVFVAALAGAVGLAILLADLAATRRIARIQAAMAVEDGPAVSVDFGLGDEVVSRAEPGGSYRDGGRVIASALGDPYRAQATLRRGLTRGVILVALSELVAISHGIARDPVTIAALEAHRCERGILYVCRRAALLTERAGQPDEDSTRLHQRACDAGDEESCLAVYLLGRRNMP